MKPEADSPAAVTRSPTTTKLVVKSTIVAMVR